jgi:putative hydrolase of the HAD superfamily
VIKHISLDVWLTLLKSNPNFKSLRNDLIIKHFDIKKEKQEVDDSFRRLDRTFTKVNEIVGKNLDSQEMFLIILADLGVALENVSADQLNDYEEQMLQLFWAYPPQFIEENFPVIAEKLVQKDITLSILSNTGFIRGKTLRQLFKYYKVEPYFAFQCYSDEEYCSKPSADFFQIVYRNLLAIKNIEKKNVLHIGDNPIADVKGANNFGFVSALFQKETNNIEKIIQQYGIF